MTGEHERPKRPMDLQDGVLVHKQLAKAQLGAQHSPDVQWATRHPTCRCKGKKACLTPADVDAAASANRAVGRILGHAGDGDVEVGWRVLDEIVQERLDAAQCGRGEIAWMENYDADHRLHHWPAGGPAGLPGAGRAPPAGRRAKIQGVWPMPSTERPASIALQSDRSSPQSADARPIEAAIHTQPDEQGTPLVEETGAIVLLGTCADGQWIERQAVESLERLLEPGRRLLVERQPVTPSRTLSPTPPRASATTGLPAAIASTGAIPKSSSPGTTYAWQRAKRSVSSARGSEPVSLTVRPASDSSRSRSGPSPTITN